jgi:hypothetical protein
MKGPQESNITVPYGKTTAFQVIDSRDPNFYDIINLLIEYGCAVNAQDCDGGTMLHSFLGVSHFFDSIIVQFLIDDCQIDYLSQKSNDCIYAWDIGTMIKNRIGQYSQILYKYKERV